MTTDEENSQLLAEYLKQILTVHPNFQFRADLIEIIIPDDHVLNLITNIEMQLYDYYAQEQESVNRINETLKKFKENLNLFQRAKSHMN